MHKMMIPLTRYAQFSGRASRSEFWWFQLFILIVFMPLHVLSFIAGYTGSEALAWVSMGLGVVVWLALLVPLVSVTVRRLHDTTVPAGGICCCSYRLRTWRCWCSCCCRAPRAATASARRLRTSNGVLVGVDQRSTPTRSDGSAPLYWVSPVPYAMRRALLW